MPKRKGYLYERMCDTDTIRNAIITGSRGKRHRHDVAPVMKDIEGYVQKVQKMLLNNEFVPTKPVLKTIYDTSSNKEREISVVPFYPDGIVHQLVVTAMKDILYRNMYPHTCASIPDRGIRHAHGYVKRALYKDRKHTKYCLKMDVKKYYPNIPIDRLMQALRHKIKDERFLGLVESIISDGTGKGLAIGYHTNQWLANFYLESLDWYIKSLPGVSYYVRYMDDMVVLGASKKKLHAARQAIEKYLNERLGLELKGNWQVFPVDVRGVDFVGYRFYHDHINLRRKNFLKLTRQLRRVNKKIELGKKICFHQASGLLSRLGQLMHCNNYKIRYEYLGAVRMRVLKDAVRQHTISNHFGKVVI